MTRVLKCVPEDLGNQFNDFKYPKWSGEPIEITCPDWNSSTWCGGGFHGITKTINRYNIFDHGTIFQVMEVDDSPENLICIDDEKVKFRTGKIIYQGKDGYHALKMVFGDFSDLDLVNWNIRAIQYFKNPSEEVQLAAVKENWYAIRYIKDPSEEVQLVAVKEKWYAIQYIEDPTEAVQLAAVKENWYAIQYIEDPTEAVKKAAAIKRN